MHVYTSALMWRPLSSPIGSQYLTEDSASHIPRVKIGLESDVAPANRLMGHLAAVIDIMPHHNDQYILSLSYGQERGLQLIQWDIKTRTKVWEKIWAVKYNKNQYTRIIYSPDKMHILVGCGGGLIVYLKLETSGLREVWSNYSLHPTALAVLPTGDQAIYMHDEESKVSQS